MTKRVSGWRSISAVPASRLPQNRIVDRKIVLHGGAADAVDAGVVRRAVRLLRHDDADADRARRLLPVGDDIGHRRIVRVDRLDEREPAGMGPLHFHRVAGVIAVHRKRRDEDRAVDADLVHRRHHLVAGDVSGPVRHPEPGPLRRVRLIGMDLGIDDRWGARLRFGSAPRSSAGPAAASAAPACSTLRRSISLSPAVDRLVISSSMALRDPRSSVIEDCRLPLAPVKGTVSCNGR